MKKIKKIINNIRFFTPIIKKVSPLTIVFTIILTILNSIYPFVWTIFLKVFIDILVTEPQISKIISTVLIYAFIVLIYNLVTAILNKKNQKYALKANYYIEKMLNDKIMLIDYYNLEDPTFIDKFTMAKKGMTEYTSGIYSFIFSIRTIVSSIITALGVIFIVLYSKEYLLIVICILGIILSTFSWSKVQKIEKKFRELIVRYRQKQYYYSYGISTFRNQKELRMYGGENIVKTKSKTINEEVFSQYKKQVKKLNKFSFLDNFTSFIIINMLSFIVLTKSVIDNNLSISDFTLLISSVNTLSNAIACIIFYYKQYSLNCDYQQDFIDLMNYESVFKDGTKLINEFNCLEFKNVSFKYPRTEQYILKNVSFKIEKNQKFSIVGLNGAGKTTIIKLICRFYQVDEGEILVNGININDYDYESYMKLISVVFQDFKIISFSIKSNISILDENQPKLYDSLEKAQVLDRVLETPNKEYTYINKWFDKEGIEFSGGEMQKFAIARSIYKESQLVVLDEPTSALDPLSESKLYYDYNNIMGKVTTIFISHRLSSCRFCDKIIVLNGASIVQEGNHDSLMKDKNGLYHEMFTAQAQYYN